MVARTRRNAGRHGICSLFPTWRANSEPDRSRVYANVRGVSSQGQVLAVAANVAQPWPCCQLIGGHMLNLGEI